MSTLPVTTTHSRPSPLGTSPLLLEQACVAVVSGGRSSERDVSLQSGAMIRSALSAGGDERGPARVRSVEILADGRWQVGHQRLSPGAALDALSDVDVFFSALHGGEGEGGAMQGLFTCGDRAFTGSGVAASAASLDKVFGRLLLVAAGACVAPGRVVSRERWKDDRPAVERELAALGAPGTTGWAVKPREGGSSVGCSIVRSGAASGRELADALDAAFAWEAEALVEDLVAGVEATGGVLELPGRGPVALPVVEIRPRAGSFFDYHEKYAPEGALELCPPETLAPKVCARIQELSLLAHRTLRCNGYSRSDFIVPPASGGNDEPVFLELNTLPGMTPRSLLPRAAAAAGIDYRTLCLLIAAEAVARRRA